MTSGSSASLPRILPAPLRASHSMMGRAHRPIGRSPPCSYAHRRVSSRQVSPGVPRDAHLENETTWTSRAALCWDVLHGSAEPDGHTRALGATVWRYCPLSLLRIVGLSSG